MMKRSKNVYKRYHYLIIAFMGVFSVIMMYPMAWMLVTSFKSNADIHKNKAKFFPAEWTVEGYRSQLLKSADWRLACQQHRNNSCNYLCRNPYQHIDWICVCKIRV